MKRRRRTRLWVRLELVRDRLGLVRVRVRIGL